jgi:DNA invertase Pin-like site-specific DNA recombinase
MTVNAVAYLRRSTNKERQEASIDTQREAVVKLAAKEGYVIIREYCDPGISGDDTERRTAFLQMRQDAMRGDFSVILCWDQDRFGRFDVLDAGHWIKPLRDAGVTLVTVAQGRINWEDFSGRLIYSIQQEGKHQFLIDQSRNVVRGMLAKAKLGEWLGGAPPWGYALDSVERPDPRSPDKIQVIKRLRTGDPDEIRIVRWLFSEYGYGGKSLGDLADRLNAQGRPGPAGKQWQRSTVHKILTRPIYQGIIAWNRRRIGKYHRIQNEEIAPAGRGLPSSRANEPDEWVTVPAPHLALVDTALFEAVQRRLVANRDCSSPNRGKRIYYFTGLITCEHCGWPMHGKIYMKRNWVSKSYICGNYNLHRTRGGCTCNTVREEVLLDVLISKIQEHFARPEVREALRAEIRRQEEAARRGEEDPVASINARIAALDRKIDTGTEKWLTAPASLTDVLGAKIEQWRADRAKLDAERRELAKPAPTVEDLDVAVDRILAGMDRMREHVRTDPHGAKAVFKALIERVVCRFRKVPYGTRERSILEGGMVVIREDVLLCRPVPLASPDTTQTPARATPPAMRSAMRRP